MYDFLAKLKNGTENLNYGRDILVDWVADFAKDKKEKIKILDIGCGTGIDILNIKKVVKNCELSGVETYPTYVKGLKEKGINVVSVNVECEELPFPDASFDVIIANQILEHTKEIFWITSEVSRILKPGGEFIVGVPNLAAFHNRILLLLGKQPACMKTVSAHVRGFTKQGMIELVESGGFFRLSSYEGSNFYPFSPVFSKVLVKLFPSFSVSIFFRFVRTEKIGNIIDAFGLESLETNYFKGTDR